jgi:hypothetical protein
VEIHVRLLGRYAIAPPPARAVAFVRLAPAVSNSLQLCPESLELFRARVNGSGDYS